jgi:hypothetical protein
LNKFSGIVCKEVSWSKQQEKIVADVTLLKRFSEINVKDEQVDKKA